MSRRTGENAPPRIVRGRNLYGGAAEGRIVGQYTQGAHDSSLLVLTFDNDYIDFWDDTFSYTFDEA